MDPFADALDTLDELAGHYGSPSPRAVRKQLDAIDPLCEELIAAAPMAILGTHDAEGRTDVTPRGGEPGFAAVLEHRWLALGDAKGNNRLDSLRNVIVTGRAGLLFLIPGREWTLRVNGSACVTTAPDVLERLATDGRVGQAASALVIDPDEVYVHCPKAFTRSKLWQPESWLDQSTLPSPDTVIRAHMTYSESRTRA